MVNTNSNCSGTGTSTQRLHVQYTHVMYRWGAGFKETQKGWPCSNLHSPCIVAHVHSTASKNGQLCSIDSALFITHYLRCLCAHSLSPLLTPFNRRIKALPMLAAFSSPTFSQLRLGPFRIFPNSTGEKRRREKKKKNKKKKSISNPHVTFFSQHVSMHESTVHWF